MDFRFVPSDPVCLASCNRKGITWLEPGGEIWTECRESQSSERHATEQRRLWRACKGVQALAPPGSWKKIWEEVLYFEYMSLHPSLIHHRNINPFENKVWDIYIFIKKCVRLFIEVRKWCLIMFLLIYVCGYFTNCTKMKMNERLM